MGLNQSKGNMYKHVTHTFNTIKGKCYHNCKYCYVKGISKRFNTEQKPVRFDETELKTNLGKDNFIFVGSSNDMFAHDIQDNWIKKTLEHCRKFDNKYLFQTKNPEKLDSYTDLLPEKSVLCTTIETNRFYPEIMGNSPHPEDRALSFSKIKGFEKHITCEPLLSFDLDVLTGMMSIINPDMINIGIDSKGHNLPEPTKAEIEELLYWLKGTSRVVEKSNLKRLLK